MTPARDVSLTLGDQKLGMVQVLLLEPATVYVFAWRLGAPMPERSAVLGSTWGLEALLRGGGV